MNDGNPFDTDHADTYDNNGSYGDSAYNAGPPPQPVQTTPAVQPPKPPPKPQPPQEQQFGHPNDQIQTFEVADNDSNPNELEKTCGGYSLGRISWWCIFCGVLLTFAGIFDMTRAPKFLDFIVDVYLATIGITIVTVEAPTCFCNKGCQQKAFRWLRMYRRNWGKAMIFFFVAVLSCAGSALKIFFGVVVMLVCFFLWYMGAQTAWIAKKMVLKILQGFEHENDDGQIATERMFKKYAKENMLTGEELVKIAAECGLALNSSEVETIALFFDEDFDGKINLNEWNDGIRRIMEGTRFM